MPTSALSPVVTALYWLLYNDATLTGVLKGNRVYVGIVPESMRGQYPRLVIGDVGEDDRLPVFKRRSAADDITIHIYSQANQMQVLDIYSRVKFLCEQPLAITGRERLSQSITFIAAVVETDNVTIHGVSIFTHISREVAA